MCTALEVLSATTGCAEAHAQTVVTICARTANNLLGVPCVTVSMGCGSFAVNLAVGPVCVSTAGLVFRVQNAVGSKKFPVLCVVLMATANAAMALECTDRIENGCRTQEHSLLSSKHWAISFRQKKFIIIAIAVPTMIFFVLVVDL